MTLKFADLEHTTTAYECVGEGPPILLMHGAEGNRHNFRDFSAELAPHATVVSYDQRGCGDTRYDGRPHTLEDLAADAAQLLDHLGIPAATTLGTSLGGRVAQAFAMFRPERVSQLMLCNTWPIDRQLVELNPEGLRKLRDLTDALPETAREVALMYYPAGYIDAHPVVVERVRARAAFAARVQRRALAVESHEDPANRIRAPVLLLSGELDEIVPTSIMRGMADTFTRARLIVMPGAGHSASIQLPQAMAQLVAEHL
ncbi:alpha/beta fold hydrolase [Variovorax sp. OV329]|uniref:alpha/beta fold hydrolase n=1 Tax=Variovorax sp. OV329 TaxID=1882825 RepID=UPI0008E2D3D5|nr:alpha/beta hydrolase [Variovorax sp. OV329]SFM92494.1 2-succinyl-6-hydroxy-2,4-cyclohexadiene-1-carboxylate synthase [Variovorax sp. OV329]